MLEFQNQLKRDYQKDPLKYGEKPLFEDLYFLYITCNLTVDEVAPYFNCKPCTVRARLKFYKIKKDNKAKQASLERRMLAKYGVRRASQRPEIIEKTKQTNLERYGSVCYFQTEEGQEKSKKTCLEKYGVEHASQNEKVKEKAKQTCQERYGTDVYFQTEEFKQKSKETCLEKYGTEYGSQSQDFREKVKQTNLKNLGVPYPMMNKKVVEKSKDTCLKRRGTSNNSTKHIDPKILELINDKNELKNYVEQFEIKDFYTIADSLGISYDGLQKKLTGFNLWDNYEHKTSHPEIELQKIFPDFYKTKKIIPPYEIDLYNEEFKLGIEFNGNYWHSEKFKTDKYHQEKSLMSLEKDIFLFHIFEYEWYDERKKSILISMLNNLIHKNPFKIGARKCILQRIDAKSCNEFLNKNHLQGQDHSSIRYGLFYNNELVSVMTFCKPRFNKNYNWELSRFCNRQNTNVIGAASKLFNYFLKEYPKQSIISYSNFSKTKGNLYRTLGFKYNNLSAPNYVWIKGLNVLSRYQCQKHLLEEYKQYGNTENEIMYNRGYHKCFDCGNMVWTFLVML